MRYLLVSQESDVHLSVGVWPMEEEHIALETFPLRGSNRIFSPWNWRFLWLCQPIQYGVCDEMLVSNMTSREG
jgi:hypothetical protein